MTNVFRFFIPDELRHFALFRALPPELRQEIWHSVVSEPGIHFVRFGEDYSKFNWVSKLDRAQESAAEEGPQHEFIEQLVRKGKREAIPRRIPDARLAPLESNPKADISHYKVLREDLTKISSVCKESASFVSGLISRPGTLAFENGGLISLQSSDDVVYIEYFPMELYQTGCALGVDPFYPQLQNIRRVAVRFCHQWQEDELPIRCKFCRQVHSSGAKKSYPTHLYQFLARCFPNLEQVWLIDYFLRPKSSDHDNTSVFRHQNGPTAYCTALDDRRLHKFRCHGRIYHEATPGLWTVKADSMHLKAWLQERFVKYARYSIHSRINNPQNVRFGFLACDWQYTNTTPKKAEIRKLPGYQSYMRRYKRPLHLTQSAAPASHMPMEYLQQSGGMRVVQANVPFVFGQGLHCEFNPRFGKS